jgi:putative transcriptional regulator
LTRATALSNLDRVDRQDVMSFPRSIVGKQGSIRRRWRALALLVGLTGGAAAFAADASAPRRTARPGLAKGVFLVAGRDLRDPNFRETVVLIIGYDQTGGMGVIVNRRTEIELPKVFPEVEELRAVKDKLFLGGPVGRDRVILLVRSSRQPEESARVVDDVFVTTSADTLRSVAAGDRREAEFHVYAGYAGWGPGQLDAEVARGDWLVTGGDARTVFDTPPAEIWPKLMQRLAGEWARLDLE